ncbi:Hsp20/alpha crystallin family protein [Xanthomarina spongicola]|uniref:HSP20 family protein n=1 Tax=Xanthomarina spongicola TaxID=570520 RepID=A0A316DRQ6_9FLAO|nr:Hsp20/alpha crystallin family protein [Xanthomarina spongicola]PWK20684.1 HSP20 family protein [Xanthomarina spongicola]
MTTLVKRRNRQLSPFRNRLLSPWEDRLFPSSLNELQNFFKFDDAFNGDFLEEDSLMPSMNVKEQKNNFEIEFAAPGFNKKDFEVTIDGNVLNVEGKKSEKTEGEEDNYTCKEFSYKSFKRSSTLPDSIDLNQEVKAAYKDGILKIDLEKKPEAKKLSTKKVVKIT